jgi:hypothetical protein
MLFARTSTDDIARTLDVSREHVEDRALSIIGAFQTTKEPHPELIGVG